jgi:SAM-dependent methyltransferase
MTDRASESLPTVKIKDPLYTWGDGFYADGDDWRWMSPVGCLHILTNSLPAEITFELSCGRAELYSRFPFDVRVYVGQALARLVTFQASEQANLVQLQLERSETDVHIRLESSKSFVPAQHGINTDVRHLSVRLSNLRVVPLERPRECPLCPSISGKAKQLLGSLECTTLHVRHLGPMKYHLVLCPNCELIYLSPLPPEEVFDGLYVNNVQFDKAARSGIHSWIARSYCWLRLKALLRRMDASKKAIRVLEIGSGLSWMCRAAKFINARSVTVAQDISSEAVGLCKWVDHYIVGEITSKLTEIKEYAPYQIISLTHVIEHLPDPIETLRICSKLLDQKGIIFITAPYRPKGWNDSSAFALWEKWSYSYVPAHLQYFNEKSMKRCAEESGLDLIFFDASAHQGQALEAWLSRARTTLNSG